MKIKGSRVLESTLTKSQQPNLMLITHILRFSHTNLRYALHCFKNHLNHSMNPFIAQITKDIRIKPNHQMYQSNETQWISNVLIDEKPSHQFNETYSTSSLVSGNHKRYQKIISKIEVEQWEIKTHKLK